VLRRGDRALVPMGVAHMQRAYRDEPYHVRVQWRPPGTAEAFGERLASMSRDRGFTRFGYPRPLAAARLGVEFGQYSHPAWPPLRVQLALATAIVRAADAAESVRARIDGRRHPL
jgi:hypothetical protein